VDVETFILLAMALIAFFAAIAWGAAAWSMRCIRRDMTWTDAEKE
jgi:hypothetical protein